MESYIEYKKNLCTSIYEFLEESDEEVRKEFFQEIINLNERQKIDKDKEEMCYFLELLNIIGEYHHRYQHFNKNMNQILDHYKDQIQKVMSNIEIFNIFQNNKKIIHFLLQNGTITISEEIYNKMIQKVENNEEKYWQFFIPEIKKFFEEEEEKGKILKKPNFQEDPNFTTNYEEKRQEGENDSFICSLIRQDSVEEFITYLNRYNISPSSQISPSVFETNQLLNDKKNTSLIEYSAFFGSIKIFRYLFMNNVELTSSLWLYSIHSNNAELIHFLESNNVPPPKFKNKKEEEKVDDSNKNYFRCLIESIKCHHNDIAKYIEDNLLDQSEIESRKEEIVFNCLKYHNYSLLQVETIIDNSVCLCLVHYDKLIDLALKMANESNKICELCYCYRMLANKTEIDQNNSTFESFTHMFIPSSITCIPCLYFRNFKSLKRITFDVDSSITKIGDNAFYMCESLTQINIPSYVTEFGENAFFGCSSLTKITIPSYVTSIGNGVFSGCSSLTQITIPTSVTEIGIKAFARCSSLVQITIPTSVTKIGESAFSECSSLEHIMIPTSVTKIGKSAFSKCSSLTDMLIPFSVTEIGIKAFEKCSSLVQISIPSSVMSIEESAFSECSSLVQITIPFSVTKIGTKAFEKCSSLAQITIPTSVSKIGDSAFSECSSLTYMLIPYSVTEIGIKAFEKCSSLVQITIPSSVTSIGNNAFSGCVSLVQITIPASINKIFLGLNPGTVINNI